MFPSAPLLEELYTNTMSTQKLILEECKNAVVRIYPMNNPVALRNEIKNSLKHKRMELIKILKHTRMKFRRVWVTTENDSNKKPAISLLYEYDRTRRLGIKTYTKISFFCAGQLQFPRLPAVLSNTCGA